MLRFLLMPLYMLRFLTQSVFIALGQIWSNRTRSILTVIGIIIGVTAVIQVIATLSGLKAEVLSELETFGTNTIFIWPSWPEGRRVPREQIRFTAETFEGMLDKCPSVRKLGLANWVGQYNVRYGDKFAEAVSVIGVEPDYHAVEKRAIVEGRVFTVIDESQGLAVCKIGIDLRDKLNLATDCTGETIIIGNRLFRIVGVMEKRPELSMLGQGGGGRDDFSIFIPYRTGLKMRADAWTWAIAEAKSAELVEEAQAEIKFFLRKARHIRPGQEDTFRVESVSSYIEKSKQIAMVITLVAGGLVGISLVVGGVGIMNIMLVSVSERTREIGLRKAIGARKSAIMMQFLIEAVVLCLFGGFIGIGLARLITLGVVRSTPLLSRTYIPGWAILIAFGFSCMVGTIFGMFPAIKAARLDPIEALRHE
jgi:putative ABC transport system permease protein